MTQTAELEMTEVRKYFTDLHDQIAASDYDDRLALYSKLFASAIPLIQIPSSYTEQQEILARIGITYGDNFTSIHDIPEDADDFVFSVAVIRLTLRRDGLHKRTPAYVPLQEFKDYSELFFQVIKTWEDPK